MRHYTSGQSYEDFLQDNIFGPLDMKDSGYDYNSAIIAHRASGYTLSDNGPVNAAFVHMSVPHAAGALYSTVEDLLRWERGLFGGKLLSAKSLAKMTEPFKGDYAMGVFVRTVDGKKVINHSGGIEGFNTFLSYCPEDEVTAVALSNLNGPAPGIITHHLAVLARGEKVVLPAEKEEISLSPEALARFVGTYQLNRRKWTIRLEGEGLTSQFLGRPKVPLFAKSETEFFYKTDDSEIEFGEDDSGAVTYFTFHAGDRYVKVPRTSDTVVERREISVPVAILEPYVGVYRLRPGFDLTITLEDGQLISQATGQSKASLSASSEATFFTKVVDAEIEFLKDDSGRVTHLVLRQGGRELRGERK